MNAIANRSADEHERWKSDPLPPSGRADFLP